jgi:hypothetical protein
LRKTRFEIWCDLNDNFINYFAMGTIINMRNTKRGFMLAAILGGGLFLTACGGDKSSVTSGTGDSGVSSDNGASSARYAGTYKGNITLAAKGSKVDNTSEKPAVLLVRSDGTARLTIDDKDVVEGSMNGNKFGFSVRVVEEDGLVKCNANAMLTGSISGSKGSGTISGSGKCKVVAAKTSFNVTGTLTVVKS